MSISIRSKSQLVGACQIHGSANERDGVWTLGSHGKVVPLWTVTDQHGVLWTCFWFSWNEFLQLLMRKQDLSIIHCRFKISKAPHQNNWDKHSPCYSLTFPWQPSPHPLPQIQQGDQRREQALPGLQNVWSIRFLSFQINLISWSLFLWDWQMLGCKFSLVSK